jgi:hypothetical protein
MRAMEDWAKAEKQKISPPRIEPKASGRYFEDVVVKG